MEKICKIIEVPVPVKTAFELFVSEFDEWWPKDYTWSQEKLVEIRPGKGPGALCTEIGPYGFRCDWGRITHWQKNMKIGLKWQIGPNREPVPDPTKASDLSLEFKGKEDASTVLVLEHEGFENHGQGAADYRDMMDGTMGWDYILNKYRQYCEP